MPLTAFCRWSMPFALPYPAYWSAPITLRMLPAAWSSASWVRGFLFHDWRNRRLKDCFPGRAMRLLQSVWDFDKIMFSGLEVFRISCTQFCLVVFCQCSLKSIRQLPTVFPSQICCQIRNWFVNNQFIVSVHRFKVHRPGLPFLRWSCSKTIKYLIKPRMVARVHPTWS